MLIHTHHTKILCIELIGTVCHSLGWLWNPSSFPAAPSSILHLFRAFLNTEQNIRASGTQKGDKSLFTILKTSLFFFFFFSFKK